VKISLQRTATVPFRRAAHYGVSGVKIRSVSWAEVAPLAEGLDPGTELSTAAEQGLAKLRCDPDSRARTPCDRNIEHVLLAAALAKALPASKRARLAPAAHYLFEAIRTDDGEQVTRTARRFALDKTTITHLTELVEPLARDCAIWAMVHEVALRVREEAAEVSVAAESATVVQVTVRGLRGNPPRRLLIDVTATLHRDAHGRFLLERPAYYENRFGYRIHRRRLTEEDLLHAIYVESGRAVAREGRVKLAAFVEHTANAWAEAVGAGLAIEDRADLVREAEELEQHAAFHRNELARIASRRDLIAGRLARLGGGTRAGAPV
jgi:hypothetical protein